MKWRAAMVALVVGGGCVEAHPASKATEVPGDDAGVEAGAPACLPADDDARLHGLPCELHLVGWWRGDADCCGAGAIVWPPDMADRHGPEAACEIVDVLTSGTGQICPPWWLAE